MNRRRSSFAAIAQTLTLPAALLALLLMPQPAMAQRGTATVGTGLRTTSSSYFEQVGTNFGFNIPTQLPNGGGSAVVGLNAQGLPGPNIAFNGAGQPALPLAGNQQGGPTFGYGIQTSLGNFFFGLSASQGASSSLSSGSASLTLPNGGSGFFGAGSLQPFVTGVVPVVGDYGNGAPPADGFGGSPLDERLQRLVAGEGAPLSPLPPAAAAHSSDPQVAASDEFSRHLAAASASSAGRPTASIADIRAAQQAEDEAAERGFRQKMQWGDEALAAGKPNVARVYYGQVARRASGALKQQALDALKSLPPAASKSPPPDPVPAEPVPVDPTPPAAGSAP